MADGEDTGWAMYLGIFCFLLHFTQIAVTYRISNMASTWSTGASDHRYEQLHGSGSNMITIADKDKTETTRAVCEDINSRVGNSRRLLLRS